MQRPYAQAVIWVVLSCTSCLFFQNKIDYAIDQALASLDRRGADIMPMMIPTLNHLVRTYGVQFNVDPLVKNLLSRKDNPRRAFLRSLDPSIMATRSELSRLTGIDAITAAAMYCDKYPLPAGFMQEIRRMSAKGGYALTHAALALIMVRAGKCDIDKKSFHAESAYAAEKLGRLMQRISPESDLGIEAIVMLYGMKDIPEIALKVPAIRPVWIVRILNAQRSDGSWDDNDHTTVLAIWALCEAKRNQTLH